MEKLTRNKVLDEIIIAAYLEDVFLDRYSRQSVDGEFSKDDLHVIILALGMFQEIARRWLERKGEENEQNRNREY